MSDTIEEKDFIEYSFVSDIFLKYNFISFKINDDIKINGNNLCLKYCGSYTEQMDKQLIEQVTTEPIIKIFLGFEDDNDPELKNKFIICESNKGFTIDNIIWSMFDFIIKNIPSDDRTDFVLCGFDFNKRSLEIFPIIK